MASGVRVAEEVVAIDEELEPSSRSLENELKRPGCAEPHYVGGPQPFPRLLQARR